MFKIPAWEDDVPKSSVILRKKTTNKKQQKKVIKLPTPEKVKDVSTATLSPKQRKKIHTPTKHEIKVNDIKIQAKKRTHNGHILNNKKKKGNKIIDISNVDTDKADELLLEAKKKKFYEPIKEDDVEDVLFREEIKKPQKKEKLRVMLQTHSNRNSIPVSNNKLRERMLIRLKAAHFRYVNEKLYTSSGAEAKALFQSDPASFHTYHQGYQQQLKKWPVNPVDVIAKRILKMPKTYTIADMGCGEAALSKRIPHQVRSFDLVSAAPGVEICDMAHTPLLAESMDVTVYCLALMGTDLTQYLVEANRVLKMDGHLLIAEVESRFDDVEAFTKEVMKLGFKLKNLDKKHKVFFFMEFLKIRDPPVKKAKLPVLMLKPCLYKKR